MENTILDQLDKLNGALGATDQFEDSADEISIGRLVKAGKIPAASAKDVTKTVNASVKRRLLNSTLSKGQRYLLSQAGKLAVDTKAAIVGGKMQFTLADLYVRRQLSGGNQQELVIPSDTLEVGKQNFNGNALAEGENVAVEAIKVSYAYSASSTDVRAQKYTNAMDAETAGSSPVDIPATLLNGEIEFRTEGTTVLKLPIKKFFREGLSVGVGTEGGSDAVHLPSPILLKARQAFSIIIHGANGQSLPLNNHFIEVRMMGNGIISRR